MLKSSTILLVRHAEKPSGASGGPGSSSAGRQRAQAYLDHFNRFRASSVDGSKAKAVDMCLDSAHENPFPGMPLG